MTYDELVTNIRNYAQVGDTEFTTAVINTFITFAENRIMREIDLDVFKKEMTGNLTANNRFLTAPLSGRSRDGASKKKQRHSLAARRQMWGFGVDRGIVGFWRLHAEV